MIARWPLVGRDQVLADLRRRLEGRHHNGGVALCGEAGVGKSRLVREVVDIRRSAGGAVVWSRATEAAQKIPLGSFAHLFTPGDEAHLRDDLLHLALARLSERAGAERYLLVVDDAHLLDEVSIALLHLAVTQSAVQVLISIRTGEPVPPGLVGLWKDELLERIDLPPLTRDSTEELIFTALDADVPASLLDRIWDLSRGNALFVRELVTAAVERHQAGGGRRVILPAEGQQQRLRELVEERLRLLDPQRRAALEVIALGERMPLDAAEKLTSREDIEDLENRGLVQIVDLNLEDNVQVAHPLYGEILAAALPRLHRRTLLRDLAAAVEDHPNFDRLRLALWHLESGEPGDPDQLLPLAREAIGRLDHSLGERLAIAAGGTSRADAGLVVGEALSGQGRMNDAEAVLADLQPTDPEMVARVAIARASNLFLHLDRSSEAFAVLQTAEHELTGHPVWQTECRSVLAQMHMFSLRLAEAGELADEVMATPDALESARVRAASVACTVHGAQGKPEAGLALLDEDLHQAAYRHRREVPYGDIQLRMARFQGLYWAGDVRALDTYTAANLGLDLEHPPPSLRGIVAGFRGGALLLRGRARAALAELQRASRTLAESDWFGQRPLAEAIRARAAVFSGDLDTADEAIRAADAAFAADPQRGARTLPHIELSRAWLVAATGTATDAADRCLALATVVEHAAKPLAVEVLHSAARLGRAADAAEALERLSHVVEGPFAGLASRHAQALAGADAEQLAAVARDFEALGADLLAAEAYRSAANAYRRQGRGASAAASIRRFEELVHACDMPRSPAFEPTLVHGEELTERELEVAQLAAAGRTSPQIAKVLYVSVRTVDTHLHRVYRKLMIDGRHQLGDALGVISDPPRGPVRSDY